MADPLEADYVRFTMAILPTLIGAFALWRLWGDEESRILWWAILVGVVFFWLCKEAVRNAHRMLQAGEEQNPKVLRFWGWVSLAVGVIVLGLSVYGIVLSFM